MANPIPENTKLLMHFEDNINDEMGNCSPALTSGSATYATGKFDKAIKLNGSQCIRIPYNADAFGFTNQDWTIAGWFYRESTDTSWRCLFGSRKYYSSGYANAGFNISLSNSNTFEINIGTSYSVKVSNTSVSNTSYFPANTWTHIALTKSGSSAYFFVNGTLRATLNLGTSTIYNPATYFYIGGIHDASTTATNTSEYFNGYVDEFIIVNGTALWTSNFTPPTEIYKNPEPVVEPDTDVNTKTSLKVKSTIKYTELSYLESNGTQYVNTGIKLSDNADIIVNGTKVTLNPIKKFTQVDFNSGTFYNGSHTLLSGQQNSSDGFTLVGTSSAASSATKYTSNYICWAYKFDFTNCKKVTYYARKNANHGVGWVYVIKDLSSSTAESNLLIQNFIHYNNLATSWTKYTLDVSNISGEAYIVFVGGYIDNTGYTTSSTSYCDIQFELNDIDYKLFSDISKVSTCQISKNNKLLYDYIPVLDENNTPCLFDRVSNSFRYGDGNGEFVTGEIVKQHSIDTWKEGSLRYKGYKELTTLEYLESTGTQWIDTGFKPNNNTRMVCDFQFTDTTASAWLMGTQEQWAVNMYDVGVLTSNGNVSTQFYSGYGTGHLYFNSIDTLARYTIDKNKNVVTLNGESVTFDNQTFQASVNAILFGRGVSGGVDLLAKVKIYSCQIYDNDVLIRDFIPVLDDNDIPCLFDKVHSKFYYNQGTGEFNQLYTELEYIQSSGTQYIDTGFKTTANTEIDILLEFTGYDTANTWNACFGARTSQTSTDAFAIFVNNSTHNLAINNSGTDTSEISGTSVSGKRQITNVGKIFYQNGTKIYTFSGSESTASYVSYIFAANLAGTARYSKMKLYHCKIYDNGTLVKDFVPAKDISGTVCLYEKVEKKFYYNKGSGTFTAGTALGVVTSGNTTGTLQNIAWHEPKEAYVKVSEKLTSLAYIESTGTQYIDTGFKPNQNTRIELSMQIPTAPSTSSDTLRLMGVRSGNSIYMLSYYPPSSRWEWMYGGSGADNFTTSVNVTDKVLVEIDGKSCRLNGVDLFAETDRTFQFDYSFYLFGHNNAGALHSAGGCSYRVWYCKIWDGDILVRDFIPVLDGNNTPCLYDKVTKQCFYNQGTGEFHYVKPIDLPEGYQQVEFIQSSGTQYINTEYYSTSMSVVFDIAFTQLTSTWQMNGWANACQGGISSGGYWHNQNTSTVKANLNQRYNVKVDVSTKGLYVDDVLVATGTATLSVPMAIGGAMNSDSNSISFPSYEKIYGTIIYDNGILVRNFIPCINASNTVGLYDLVENKFYTNAGTGTFATGSVIDKISDDEIIQRAYWKEIGTDSTPKYEQLVNYTMLYDYGDECTSVTGGWGSTFAVSRWASGNTNGLSTTPATKNSTYATIKVSSTYQVCPFNTLSKLKFSNYNKLGIIRQNTVAMYSFNIQLVTSLSGNYVANDGTMPSSCIAYIEKGKTVTSTPELLIDDISSYDTDAYLSIYCHRGISSDAYGTSNIYSVFVTQEDNWSTLASKAGVTATTISALLTSSSAILANQDAVEFMVAQCTGDFMASAIQNSTFMTALASSPYKEKIYANEHWAKFLAMVA